MFPLTGKNGSINATSLKTTNLIHHPLRGETYKISLSVPIIIIEKFEPLSHFRFCTARGAHVSLASQPYFSARREGAYLCFVNHVLCVCTYARKNVN